MTEENRVLSDLDDMVTVLRGALEEIAIGAVADRGIDPAVYAREMLILAGCDRGRVDAVLQARKEHGV